MKQKLLFSIYLLLCHFSFAQSDSLSAEYLSVSACTPFYVGDIHDYRQEIRGGVSVAYTFPIQVNSPFSLTVSALHTSMKASDANAPKTDDTHWRNLNFKSALTEFGIHTAYTFRRYKRLKPSVQVGIGLLFFNPKAKLDGTWYELQPLGTEGQYLNIVQGARPYKLSTFCFSLGTGLRYKIHERWEIYFEERFQLAMTDYLDDVSTVYPPAVKMLEYNAIAFHLSNRNANMGWVGSELDGKPRGNPKTKDGYFLTSFGLSYRLKKKEK